MRTLVGIDRGNQAARIEVAYVIDAGWLGHKFAARHPDLIAQGWNIVCYQPGDLPSEREQRVLEGNEKLSYSDTTIWVDKIAAWIEDGPCYQYCSQCGRGGKE